MSKRIRRLKGRRSVDKHKPISTTLRHPGLEQQEQMSIWNLSGSDAFVNPEKHRRLPRWVVPSLAAIVIVTLVFWGIPGIVAHLRSNPGYQNSQAVPATPLYSEYIRVVVPAVADVFDDDDLHANRITQVLYNEPVEVLFDNSIAFGFVRVRLMDGYSGFMRSHDLTDNRISIEPENHMARIQVTDLTKRILSHESNGTLISEVMMGTMLLADYKGDGVFRVTLPNGDKGWIGSNGVMELAVDDLQPPTTESGRYFVNSALSFMNVPYIENGISRYGACPEGIARVAAMVNGIRLPRTLEGLIQSGRDVGLSKDDDGKTDYEAFEFGDLLFFSDTPVKFAEDGESVEPARLGIYVDYAQVLTYRIGRSDMRIISLLKDTALSDRLFAVRRIVPNPAESQ